MLVYLDLLWILRRHESGISVCDLEEGKGIVNLANLRIRISEFAVVSPKHFLRFPAFQSRHHGVTLLASFCKCEKQ